MTQKFAPKVSKSASLIRTEDEPQSLPGFVAIGERMARGIRAIIADHCSYFPLVTSQPIKRMTYSEWCTTQNVVAGVSRFKIKPLRSTMLIVMPSSLVAQMVDGFYGGEGGLAIKRVELSKAEMRFVERLSETLVDVIAAAWVDVVSLTPSLVSVETDIAQLCLVKEADQVIVQSIRIVGAPFGSVDVDCVYPAAALRSVKSLSASQDDENAAAVDLKWQGRMRDTLMQVHLPIRTIFARTELPLTRLLQLHTGDMIPICLPNRIPVTIGGFTFAEATVGESNGRASIRIEKLEQGLISNG
jgi:flagellar motor switch protein FliM